MPKVIPLLTLEARIKRQLRSHLRRLGFTRTSDGLLSPPGNSKESFRALHRLQRLDRLRTERDFIKTEWKKLNQYFANGIEVEPAKIKPRLELIEADTWQSKLFRLASLTWSVPVSQGYGRRMRFLIWDDSNGKLIGLLALGDPVFNLRVRDELIGWSAKDRKERLVNVLDAYILGALPPYNFLLGGKLIASLIRTKEVRDAFSKRYATSRGIISKRRKHPSLVLVTTSSALGRSSIYNRVTLGSIHYLEPIGYTSGWGHFHIPQRLFQLIREYLKEHEHKYEDNNRFGDGPNWRLRALRHTLSELGLNPDLLRHNVTRQVFICELAKNAKKFLAGKVKHLRYNGLLSVTEVSILAKSRWVQPRAERFTYYRNWKKDQILLLLVPSTRKIDLSNLETATQKEERNVAR